MKNDALYPLLLSELETLEEEEQKMLAELLIRAKQDRSDNGILDEIAFITNSLKAYPSSDYWIDLIRAKEKIGPMLYKDFGPAKQIPLATNHPKIDISLSDVISDRVSSRDYAYSTLSFNKICGILTEACGIRGRIVAYNRPDVPLRNFPSAGGLQCIEIYIAVNDVENLSKGLYYYNSILNCFVQVETGNFRWRVAECCPQHDWLSGAAAVIFIAPNIGRLSWKYKHESYRLVHIDTGVVAENIHFVSTALGVGSCMLFGFIDDTVNQLLGLDGRQEFVTLLISLGEKRETYPIKNIFS